jgi:hypothetical protein
MQLSALSVMSPYVSWRSQERSLLPFYDGNIAPKERQNVEADPMVPESEQQYEEADPIVPESDQH